MNRSFSFQNVLFGFGAFISVVFTVVIFRRAAAMPDATTSYAFGYALGPLIFALVARGLYAAVRSPRVPFLSGWIFLLAAAFAFFTNWTLINNELVNAKQEAAPGITAEVAVDAWVTNGMIDIQQWCNDSGDYVAAHPHEAFAIFKREYGTRQPPAKAVFNELVSRCSADA